MPLRNATAMQASRLHGICRITSYPRQVLVIYKDCLDRAMCWSGFELQQALWHCSNSTESQIAGSSLQHMLENTKAFGYITICFWLHHHLQF